MSVAQYNKVLLLLTLLEQECWFRIIIAPLGPIEHLIHNLLIWATRQKLSSFNSSVFGESSSCTIASQAQATHIQSCNLNFQSASLNLWWWHFVIYLVVCAGVTRSPRWPAPQHTVDRCWSVYISGHSRPSPPAPQKHPLSSQLQF